jgi:hypothetical protein
MAEKTSILETQKTTVVFPKSLLRRLRERVPPRQRSAFIAEAVEEKLALEEHLVAIEETAGCWSDEDHPELKAGEDIDSWLNEIRQSWDNHLVGYV